MLAAVCESLGWEYGALWEVDRGGKTLHCVGTWHAPSLQVTEFVEISRTTRFTRGVGLPGRVWDSGRPAWIPDVVGDRNFPRAAAADRVGLHGAFALPILRGSDVLGVMEFFSRDIRQPDAALLDTMMTAGAQIGLYVARKWAADELETFFTLSLDLLCVASLDGYFLRLNPAWTHVLGFDEAELRASPFLDFVHPDDRAATLDAVSALTAGSRLINFENRYRARDGSYRWLEWAAAPSLDQGVIYAAARDVTDRKRADEALKESTENLKQLVTRARRRPAEGRSGGDRQGGIPREHEPRDPHADERRDRHDRSRAAHAAHAAAAGIHSHRQRVGRSAAHHPQRHPRRLEDRGGTAGARSGAVQPSRRGGRRRQAVRDAGGCEAARAGLPHSARCARRARRRSGASAPGAGQPGRQRDQIHGRPATSSSKCRRRASPARKRSSSSRSPTPASGSRRTSSGRFSARSSRPIRPRRAVSAAPASG